MNIGLDRLSWIVFAGRHLLQSCSMDDIIYTFKCSGQTFLVSDITNEETKFISILFEFILHDKLLELITGINDDLPGIVVVQHILGKCLTKTAGTTCNQNGFII